jgi:hypothetical protein
LGRKDESIAKYNELIAGNPDNLKYHKGLLTAHGFSEGKNIPRGSI